MVNQKVQAAISNTQKSDLIRWARKYDQRGLFKLYNYTAPYFWSMYSSTKMTLYDSDSPMYSLYGWLLSESEWNDIGKYVLNWSKKHLIPALYDEYSTYYKEKWGEHLAHMSTESLIGNISNYGINKGIWPDIHTKTFDNIINKYYEAYTWYDQPWNDVPKELLRVKKDKDYNVTYDELVMHNPAYGALRMGASSGYPHCTHQSPAFVINELPEILNRPGSKRIIVYHRRHGATIVIEHGFLRMKIKIRFVGGGSFWGKCRNLGLTKSFKDSAPRFTPYFKSWEEFFLKMLLPVYEKYDGTKVLIFTTDQAGFDMHHDSRVLARSFGLLTGQDSMPDHMKKALNEIYVNDYQDPALLLTAKHAIKLNRDLSISGSGPTPMIETKSNLGSHDTSLCIMKKIRPENYMDVYSYILENFCQIDDTIYFVDGGLDLHEFAKVMLKYFGFEMNPDKTETNEKGYCTMLQNNIGKLTIAPYNSISGPIVAFSYIVLGSLLRKIHRMRFKERGMSAEFGDVVWIRDEELITNWEHEFRKKKNVHDKVEELVRACESFLGSLGGLGPSGPLDIIDHMSDRFMIGKPYDRFGKYLIQFVKSKARPYVRSFGWTPEPVKTYLMNKY